jgi:hypothetical protein
VWIVVALNAWKKPCDRGIEYLGSISRTTVMQNATHRNNRRNGGVAGYWRIAILASFGGFLLAAVALPVSLESNGLALNLAFAGSEDGTAGGNGKGPQSTPGKQTQEDFTVSEDLGNDDVESALAESGESAQAPATVPISEDAPAKTNVIKEIAGLAGDAELSEEEEIEAIRSGWGTWRTADGPETIIAQ